MARQVIDATGGYAARPEVWGLLLGHKPIALHRKVESAAGAECAELAATLESHVSRGRNAGPCVLTAHKRKPQELTKRVQDLVENYGSGKMVLTIRLSNFRADWLRQHIKEDDIAVVKYLTAHPSQ